MKGCIVRFLASCCVALFLSGCVHSLPKSVATQKNLEYSRVTGKPLLLDLYTPREVSGKLPVLVWIHGGSWRYGSKDPCPLAFIAASNLAIVSLNYRLSGEAPFPAQLEDCKAAIRWLRAHANTYHLDPERIGVFGASAGGHLAALLGTTANVPELEGKFRENLAFSSRVQAVLAFYPPTDLDALVVRPFARRNPRSDVGRLLGGALEKNRDRAALANPMRYISKDTPPFFIMHGERDRLVPISQSELLNEALKQAGVEVVFAPVPGKGHGIGAPPEVAHDIMIFIRRHLLDGASGIPAPPGGS